MLTLFKFLFRFNLSKPELRRIKFLYIMELTNRLWARLGLLNLLMVAFLGMMLRTRFLFSISFVDYRNFLAAHGVFAINGWVAFSLAALLVGKLLGRTHSRTYNIILVCWFILSWLTLAGFLFLGPAGISYISNSLLILVQYIFSFVFIKDVLKRVQNKSTRVLAVSAAISLILASAGTILLGLMYGAGIFFNVTYRDASYTFLHFQYNGFFSLGIFALIWHQLILKGVVINLKLKRFTWLLSLSTLPTLFLSFLYHEKIGLYIPAILGGFMLVGCIYYLFSQRKKSFGDIIFREAWARHLFHIAMFSFLIKLLLQLGTLVPSLGHAIYSDRPVIIGFLHLVFLAFASFYIISVYAEEGKLGRRFFRIPIAVFAFGVICTELILMIQGVEILFRSYNQLYNWLLWVASILLFLGALLLLVSSFLKSGIKKRAEALH